MTRGSEPRKDELPTSVITLKRHQADGIEPNQKSPDLIGRLFPGVAEINLILAWVVKAQQEGQLNP